MKQLEKAKSGLFGLLVVLALYLSGLLAKIKVKVLQKTHRL